MSRQYECLYIIASNVTEEKRNELIAKFSQMASKDAVVEKWGMRKFATPINYRNEGFYVLMTFCADAQVPAKIGALMNITDGIVRYMFTQKNDKQIAQDQKRKNAVRERRAFVKSQPTQTEDTASDGTDAPTA